MTVISCLQAVFADASRHIAELAEMRAREQELEIESLTVDSETSADPANSGQSCVGLDELQARWSEMSQVAEVACHGLSADVSHWNMYESARSKFSAWLHNTQHYADSSEKLSASLEEAKQQLEKHKGVLNEMVYHEAILRELVTEASYLVDKPGIAENVEEFNTQWEELSAKLAHETSVLQNAVETWTRYVDHSELVRRQIATIFSRKQSVGNPITRTTDVGCLQDQLKVFKVCRYIHLCVFLSLSFCLSFYLSLFVSLFLSSFYLYLSVSLSFYLSPSDVFANLICS